MVEKGRQCLAKLHIKVTFLGEMMVKKKNNKEGVEIRHVEMKKQ